MRPELLTVQDHQKFKIERIMRIISCFSDNQLNTLLLDLMEGIMIQDNLCKFFFSYDSDRFLSPDVFSLTLEQEFSFCRMRQATIARDGMLQLIEGALYNYFIKNNVIQDFLAKSCKSRQSQYTTLNKPIKQLKGLL